MTELARHRGIVVDQHPLWLDAVEEVMGRVDVDVVEKTTSLRQAMSQIRALQPDVVVAELHSGTEDYDATSWLTEFADAAPRTKLIVLSLCSDTSAIEAALGSGASAYVIKTAHPDDLAAAIRQAFDHSIYLRGSTVRTPQEVPARETATENVGLTRRELEILRLVAEGLSNAQLARMLWVTEQTVKFHLSNVYRKLGVANRTEASRWAQLNGLLPAEALSSNVA